MCNTNKRNRVHESAKEQEGLKVRKSGRNLYNYIVILKSKELLFLLRKKNRCYCHIGHCPILLICCYGKALPKAI